MPKDNIVKNAFKLEKDMTLKDSAIKSLLLLEMKIHPVVPVVIGMILLNSTK